jgi:hypothetical protein
LLLQLRFSFASVGCCYLFETLYLVGHGIGW